MTKKKKEVIVRRARPSASKLCNLCIVICDNQGLSIVACDNKAHWTNEKHITVAAFVSSDDVWCQVCQSSTNLELQSAKNENMSKGPAKLSKENVEKKKVFCKNQTAFDSHLKNQNDAAMVKEQTEDSRRSRQEFDQEKPRESLKQALIVDSRKIQEESYLEKETTEEHPLANGSQESKEEVKEMDAVSENLERCPKAGVFVLVSYVIGLLCLQNLRLTLQLQSTLSLKAP